MQLQASTQQITPQSTGSKQKPEIHCSPIRPTVPQPIPTQDEGYHLRSRVVDNTIAVNSRRKAFNAAAEELNKTNNKKSKKIFGKNGDKSA